jgi:hypothetical protein
MAVLRFSPDLDFGWPMIVFPAATGFVAAVGAKFAAAQSRETRSSAWFVFVPVATVFGLLLWAGRIAVSNLQPAVPFLHSGLLIVQEVRILRLKRRLAERASDGATQVSARRPES